MAFTQKFGRQFTFAALLGGMLPIGLGFLSPVFAQKPASPPPATPSPAADNVPLTVLPFELEDSWIILSLPLIQTGAGEKYQVPKEARPLRLILDSGADGSGLAEETFAERKLPLPPPQKDDISVRIGGIGNGESVSARLLTDIRYGVGDISFNDSPALAPLGELHKMRIDGLLGANVFRALVVEVDYAQKIIRFFDPTTFSPPGSKSGFTRVSLQRIARSNRVSAPVEVTAFGFSKTTAQLEVDTGHATNLYFTSPFVKRNKWEAFAPRTIETQSMGMGGVSNSRVGRLKEIGFGGVTIAAPIANFSFDTKGAMTDTNSDGLIGGGILSRFTVIFDYSRDALYVRPNTTAHAPFVYQKFGFETASAPSAAGGWLVTDVSSDGAMARVGIKKGDYLFAIDKMAIDKLTEAEFGRVLDARTGERIFTVGDAKGEKKREVRITPIAL